MLHIETCGVSAENALPRKGQPTFSVERQAVACLRPIAKQVTLVNNNMLYISK